MLVLFETAAGFALFKVLNKGKVESAQDLWQDFATLDAAQKVSGAAVGGRASPCACRRLALPWLEAPEQRRSPRRRRRAGRQAQGLQQVRQHHGRAGRRDGAGGQQAQQA